MQNVVAVIVIACVLWAFWRRVVTKRPKRLTFNTDALLILGMIGGVVATELFAMVFESARFGVQDGAFIANALAAPLAGSLAPETLEVGFLVMWWAHMLLVAAFLVYLPFSKHLHIATSFPNIYFRKLAPRGELPKMDLEDENATFGLRTLADLGWKDQLDGFTCTECGRCQQACPAWNTGKPLNPKTFIMGIRDMSVEAEHGLPLIPNSPSAAGFGLTDVIDQQAMLSPIVDNAIPFDAVWDCVTCGACVEACPVLIEHVDKIVGLRRNLVLEDSRFPTELNGAFRNMEGVGNPWGQPPTTRTDWTKNLPFAVPTVADMASEGTLGELEVLYWVGCAAAFDERNRKVARAFATCMNAAGIKFAILGQEESCTGDPARRMGNDYVFQMLATGNIETLNRYQMGERTIVTACPHCFNSIGNEYGQLGGNFRVIHHAAYLRELLANGRLRVVDADAGSDGSGGTGRSVTLHDSCYLTRYNGVVEEPREVLGSIAGLEIREMDNRGRNTFCCGAGGGRMWMEETRGTRINESRTAQALATGAETVATECPFCMTMLKDGLEAAQSGSGGTVKAIDIAELLAESLAPTQPGSRALPVLQ
jgi:Fe-S oxidoreductase